MLTYIQAQIEIKTHMLSGDSVCVGGGDTKIDKMNMT